MLNKIVKIFQKNKPSIPYRKNDRIIFLLQNNIITSIRLHCYNYIIDSTIAFFSCFDSYGIFPYSYRYNWNRDMKDYGVYSVELNNELQKLIKEGLVIEREVWDDELKMLEVQYKLSDKGLQRYNELLPHLKRCMNFVNRVIKKYQKQEITSILDKVYSTNYGYPEYKKKFLPWYGVKV